MTSIGLCINPGKNELVQSGGGNYLCHAIKTKVITNKDSLTDIIADYAKPHLRKGDILFLSEKMVACTQGRAIPISAIKPGFLAGLLSKFVAKSKAGIGLAMPETMQCSRSQVRGSVSTPGEARWMTCLSRCTTATGPSGNSGLSDRSETSASSMRSTRIWQRARARPG